MIPADRVKEKFGEKPFLSADSWGIESICDLANGRSTKFPGNAELAWRSEAETWSDRKHLIVYPIVTLGGKVLNYRRTKSGGEGRLHGMRSLGFGGHVTNDDCERYQDDEPDSWSSPRSLAKAALRELHEELDIRHEVTLNYVGAISDDSDDVGRVHLGLVFEARLTADPSLPLPVAKEPCIAELEFKGLDELRESAAGFESWSRILIERVLRPARTTFF